MKRIRFSRPSAVFRGVLLLAAVPLLGCHQDQTKAIDDLKRQIAELTRAATDRAASVDMKTPVVEIEKLFRFEYRVFAFADLSAEEMTTELNRLGEERWDCFFVERRTAPASGLNLFCKRRPDSLLRYFPQGAAGGLLGLLR